MGEGVYAVPALRTGAAPLHAKLDQLARVLNRKKSQQDLVDEREDGGVGADSQGERNDRREREPGFQPELAQTVL